MRFRYHLCVKYDIAICCPSQFDLESPVLTFEFLNHQLPSPSHSIKSTTFHFGKSHQSDKENLPPQGLMTRNRVSNSSVSSTATSATSRMY